MIFYQSAGTLFYGKFSATQTGFTLGATTQAVLPKTGLVNVDVAAAVLPNGNIAAAVSGTDGTRQYVFLLDIDVETGSIANTLTLFDQSIADISGLSVVDAFTAETGWQLPIDIAINGTEIVVAYRDAVQNGVGLTTLSFEAANSPPAITSNSGGDTAAISITENSTAVTTVTATDTDANTTLSYAISGGADAALFQIDAATGALSFKAAPNFEAPADVGTNNVYDVIVQVSDGALTDTQAVAVTVTNANEAPVFSLSTQTPGGSADGHTYSVVVGASGLTWREARTQALAMGGDLVSVETAAENEAVFELVDQSSGAWTSFNGVANLGPEIGPWIGIYRLAAGGSPLDGYILANGQSAVFTSWHRNFENDFLNNPNAYQQNDVFGALYRGYGDLQWLAGANTMSSNPVSFVVEFYPAKFSVSENLTFVGLVTATDVDAGSTLSYSISGGVDAALFQIDPGTGALSFKAAPNFEAPADVGTNNVYDVIVQVSDGALTDTQAVAVTVTDMDEIAPVVASLSPADTATGVAVASNVVLTFNEAIARGAGTIQIRSGSATGTIVESFDAATSGRLTLSGSTLTIDPTNNLAAGTRYFVVMPSGAIRDVAGNNYAGTNTYDFTTAPPDTTAPRVSTFSPSDAARNVAVASNVVLTFNEAIARGAGTIQIRSGSATGTIVESFDAATSGRLTLSGSTLTIDPTNNLAAGTRYFVVMPSGAIRDVAGNNYAGTNTYDFTTAAPDTTAPRVSTFSPSDAARNVAVASNVVLTFNEAIARGAGTIQIRSGSATGTIVESFDAATSARLTLSGSTLTIDPTNNLVAGTQYFVVLPAGAVRDVAGNNYAGTTSYDFTTAIASGTAGNDTLIGTTGTDNLNGLAGNDVIDGLGGNDTIRGGTGADRLTGGAGRDTFVFAPGDSGQTSGFDVITDYTKGSTSVGDLIDFSSNLTRGGNANTATATQASINQTTGVATFAAGSGTTLSDALADIAARFTAATNSAGEFAFFKVNNTGNFHMFISDGVAGVTANDVVIEMINLTSITNINITSGNMTILG